MSAELLWLIVAVVLLLAEALTSQLVSIWFALGAVVTMIASALGLKDLTLQLLVFVVSSTLLLIFTRPFVKKYLMKNNEKTNVDSLIGQSAIVCEDIDNLEGVGAAKVDGKVWTARSMSSEPIKTGTTVEVVEIKGVKLIVREIA